MLDTKQLLDLANFREGVREYGRARDGIHRFFVDEAPRNLALKSAASRGRQKSEEEEPR